MAATQLGLVFFAALTVCLAGPLCTSEDISRENTKKLAKANNVLAVNVYRQLSSKSSGNIFYSPFSLSSAFGMLFYGAKGETAEELRSTLGYKAADLPEELVHQTFQKYITKDLPSQDPDAYVLNSANAAVLDKSLNVVPSYKSDVQNLYQATVRDVDFASNNQEVLQEINDWVKEKTNGKIDKLVEELDPTTAFVLLNAVYFKGTWKTQFDPRFTKPQKFYNNGLESEAKEVPMMRLEEELSYTFSPAHGVEAVELPYKGENISMIVLVPEKRDGLKSFEESFSLEDLNTIRQELYETEVHLTLPKFKIEDSREMSGDFISLGAKQAFSPGADFSGMIADKNVYVSQVVHKAVIEVNEEGSEAAGVTGIISNRMGSDTPVVFVDRPFLFAIVDNRNDMILFVGRVTDL